MSRRRSPGGPLRRQHRVGDVDLSVLEAGPGDGETVVLLHGIPTGAELWRDVVEWLAAAGYRALAPDLLGYGLTRAPADLDHSLEGSAEVVAAWLRARAGGPVWIAGHDLGGIVTQLLLVQHPDVVARASFANSPVEDSWPVPAVRLARAGARLGAYPATAALRLVPNPYLRHEIVRLSVSEEVLAEQDRVFWDAKVHDRRGRRAFARHLRTLDPAVTQRIAARLATVEVPTQVVWGMADPAQTWDAVGARLAALLPDPAVRQLEGCGHFTPLECPAALADAFVSWRRGTSG